MKKTQKSQKKNTRYLVLGILSIAIVGTLMYQFYSIKKLNQSITTLQTQLDDKYKETNDKIDSFKDDVSIYLPDTIYVANDVTTELYNSQITSLGGKIDEYNVTWVCDIGKNMERKFSIMGTKELIGEYPIEFQVYDNKRNLIASKSSVLSIVDNQLSKPISILTIGDSLSSDANTYLRIAELGQGNVNFVGTRDIDGYKCEARIGFAASDYLTETHFYYETGEPLQPFFNKETNQFDWNYYKKTTGIQPDVVEIFLGTNGIDVDPTVNGDDIIHIIDFIRQADPSIPIYMVNTIYTANQDGIGSWENTHNQPVLPGRYKFEEDKKVFNLMVYLSEKLANYDKVYLVPAAITFDSVNDFQTNTELESPYASATVEVPDNGIHPGKAGYKQIGDTIYSTICGTMGKW